MAGTPLTLYLFQEHLSLTKERIRHVSQYKEVALVEADEADVVWRLYLKQAPPQPASWLSRLQPIMVNPDAHPIVGQSAGGVLLVSAHGRLWGATSVPATTRSTDQSTNRTSDCGLPRGCGARRYGGLG